MSKEKEEKLIHCADCFHSEECVRRAGLTDCNPKWLKTVMWRGDETHTWVSNSVQLCGLRSISTWIKQNKTNPVSYVTFLHSFLLISQIMLSCDARNTAWVSFDGRKRQEICHGDRLVHILSTHHTSDLQTRNQRQFGWTRLNGAKQSSRYWIISLTPPAAASTLTGFVA